MTTESNFEFLYEKILRVAIQHSSGITAKQIAALLPEEELNSISSTCCSLKMRGCLEVVGEEKDQVSGGRPAHIFKTTGIPYEHTEFPSIYRPVSKKLVKETLNEVEQLKDRVRELENWMNEALRRFPELAVPEDLLEARKTAAEIAKAKGMFDRADLIMKGERDHIPIVQNALETIRGLQ